jgi:NAD(P)H-hydrate epimerase
LVLGDSRKPPAVCSDGNPGMASGGMGDVLSGIAGALMAQGHDAARAAELATIIHALAGDLAAADGQRGLLATDLIAHLRRLVNPERMSETEE